MKFFHFPWPKNWWPRHHSSQSKSRTSEFSVEDEELLVELATEVEHTLARVHDQKVITVTHFFKISPDDHYWHSEEMTMSLFEFLRLPIANPISSDS